MKEVEEVKGYAYSFQKPKVTAQLKAYYDRLGARSIAPLWEVLGDVITASPKTACVPAIWRYDEVRPLLMEAGDLIPAEEAERRALMLQNPALGGQPWITTSLYAAMQLVQPGEVARAHRHTASALRFVLENDGDGYTSVDGERSTMRPGDFVLTPAWTFHDHGNPGDKPIIWMDGLDIPIINMLGLNFAELWPEETFPVSKNEGDALARYGNNLLPVEYSASSMTAPIFNYPYVRSREVLEELYKNGPIHECHGVKLQYVNPATGGYPMPAIAGFIQLLPPGFKGAPYRSTDGTVLCPTEGSGRTTVGDVTFDWNPRDVFVVPTWYPVKHETEKGAVLFSFSDRAVQKALGLWREEAPVRL
jgi:gentisate 1,2-dioxygenase